MATETARLRLKFYALRTVTATGATGTGKTVTLQGLAEGLSDQGVPVFCADVKSDLSGLAEPGEPKPWIEARAKEIASRMSIAPTP